MALFADAKAGEVPPFVIRGRRSSRVRLRVPPAMANCSEFRPRCKNLVCVDPDLTAQDSATSHELLRIGNFLQYNDQPYAHNDFFWVNHPVAVSTTQLRHMQELPWAVRLRMARFCCNAFPRDVETGELDLWQTSVAAKEHQSTPWNSLLGLFSGVSPPHFTLNDAFFQFAEAAARMVIELFDSTDDEVEDDEVEGGARGNVFNLYLGEGKGVRLLAREFYSSMAEQAVTRRHLRRALLNFYAFEGTTTSLTSLIGVATKTVLQPWLRGTLGLCFGANTHRISGPAVRDVVTRMLRT